MAQVAEHLDTSRLDSNVELAEQAGSLNPTPSGCELSERSWLWP